MTPLFLALLTEPGVVSLSMRMTCRPASAKYRATLTPTAPPPITSTSVLTSSLATETTAQLLRHGQKLNIILMRRELLRPQESSLSFGRDPRLLGQPPAPVAIKLRALTSQMTPPVCAHQDWSFATDGAQHVSNFGSCQLDELENRITELVVATLLQHVPASGENLMRLPRSPGDSADKSPLKAPSDWIICGKQTQKRFVELLKKSPGRSLGRI